MHPHFVEGHSLYRPPFFDGTNYTYWKRRMQCFVQSTDYRLWKVIDDGPHIPKKTENGLELVKHETEWNEQDIKMIELNAGAMKMMYCAVKPEEYRKLSTCNSAKEVWDKLQAVYEGEGSEREIKIDMLLNQFDRFHMRKNECIDDMFGRLSNIINDLDALGITHSNEELVQKVHRILLFSEYEPWHAKAMQIGKYLNRMTYDKFRGDLIICENKHISCQNKKHMKNISCT